MQLCSGEDTATLQRMEEENEKLTSALQETISSDKWTKIEYGGYIMYACVWDPVNIFGRPKGGPKLSFPHI